MKKPLAPYRPNDPILINVEGDYFVLQQDYNVRYGQWFSFLSFTIPAEFETDLASIPRPLWWIVDRSSLGYSSVVIHDYLCKSKGKITTIAGQEIKLSCFDVHLYFLNAMRLDNIHPIRAFIAFIGVNIGCRW